MKAKLQDYFLWDGELVQVVSINTGHRSIGFRSVKERFCPNCDHKLDVEWFDVIEDSPLFKEKAKPINTISE